eukprot:COSAG02_NODE_35702_length_464_cov_3.501370_1_plen_78_part_00
MDALGGRVEGEVMSLAEKDRVAFTGLTMRGIRETVGIALVSNAMAPAAGETEEEDALSLYMYHLPPCMNSIDVLSQR